MKLCVRSVAGSAVVAMLLACGGSATPAQDADGANAALLESEPSTPSQAPSAPSAEVARGVKFLDSGDRANARIAFASAVRKNDKDVEAHYYTGLMADEDGHPEQAAEAYDRALALRPSFEQAALNRAAQQIAAAQFSAAETTLTPALKADPNNAALNSNLALALDGKGDQAGAKAALARALKAQPADAELQLLAADRSAAWGDAASAKRHFLRGAELAKDNVEQLTSAAYGLKNLGAFGECAEQAGKAHAALGKAPGQAMVLTLRALCKLGAKDDAGATADLREATVAEPNWAPAHYYLGGRLAEAEQWADAEKAYNQYLKLAGEGGEMSGKARERLGAIKTAKAKGKGKSKAKKG